METSPFKAGERITASLLSLIGICWKRWRNEKQDQDRIFGKGRRYPIITQ
jgi:hypothetical protein